MKNMKIKDSNLLKEALQNVEGDGYVHYDDTDSKDSFEFHPDFELVKCKIRAVGSQNKMH